jgi:hypothetical protein
MRRQEEHKYLLRPLNRQLKDLRSPWRMSAIALALVMPMLATFTDIAHATTRSSVYAAKHHASARPHVREAPHRQAAKKVEVRAHAPSADGLRSSFCLPAGILNNGPTQAPLSRLVTFSKRQKARVGLTDFASAASKNLTLRVSRIFPGAT